MFVLCFICFIFSCIFSFFYALLLLFRVIIVFYCFMQLHIFNVSFFVCCGHLLFCGWFFSVFVCLLCVVPLLRLCTVFMLLADFVDLWMTLVDFFVFFAVSVFLHHIGWVLFLFAALAFLFHLLQRLRSSSRSTSSVGTQTDACSPSWTSPEVSCTMWLV